VSNVKYNAVTVYHSKIQNQRQNIIQIALKDCREVRSAVKKGLYIIKLSTYLF
jgi:hypothetical protein